MQIEMKQTMIQAVVLLEKRGALQLDKAPEKLIEALLAQQGYKSLVRRFMHLIFDVLVDIKTFTPQDKELNEVYTELDYYATKLNITL